MSKLATFKRNLANHKVQRERADDQREFENRMVQVVNELRDYPDVITDPPDDLIQLYCAEAEVYARERILGDNTYTREQQASMMDSHLNVKYQGHLAAATLGHCNRRSYWRPSVKVEGEAIAVYLATKKIGVLS